MLILLFMTSCQKQPWIQSWNEEKNHELFLTPRHALWKWFPITTCLPEMEVWPDGKVQPSLIILQVKSSTVTLDHLGTLNYQSQTHRIYSLTRRVLSRKDKSNLFLIWYITPINYSLLDTCNIQLGIFILASYSNILYEYPSNNAIQRIHDVSLPTLLDRNNNTLVKLSDVWISYIYKEAFFDILKIAHIL